MGLTPHQEMQVQKRVPDNVCARCRRPFAIGHRVQTAYIVYEPNARNPEKVTERGMELGVDHEFVHASCEDPFLEGKVASRLILPA